MLGERERKTFCSDHAAHLEHCLLPAPRRLVTLRLRLPASVTISLGERRLEGLFHDLFKDLGHFDKLLNDLWKGDFHDLLINLSEIRSCVHF